jgi:hypothetical protein
MLQLANQQFSHVLALPLKKYSKNEYHQEVDNLTDDVRYLENLLIKLRKPYSFPKSNDSYLIRTKYKKNVIQTFLDSFKLSHNVFAKELIEKSIKEIQIDFGLDQIFAENELGQKNAREEMENLLLLSLFYISHISKNFSNKVHKATNTTSQNYDKSLDELTSLAEKKAKFFNNGNKTKKENDYSMYIKIIEEKTKEIENLKKKYNKDMDEITKESVLLRERERALEEENEFLKKEMNLMKEKEEDNEINEKKNRKIKYAIIDEIVFFILQSFQNLILFYFRMKN